MAISAMGLFVFLFLAWLVGRRRGSANLRVVVWGMALQLAIGLVVFRTEAGRVLLLAVNDAVATLLASASAGPQFLFGELANPATTGKLGLGFILFFQGLLSIIVISALIQILYHIGLMGLVLKAFARVFTRLMRISGVEGLAASANIFVGNESILSVRPFLGRMTPSELCVLMTACMATVSANIMGVYVAMLHDSFPGIAGHMASASLLSAPAALVCAKLIWPETETPETLGLHIAPKIDRSPNIVMAVIAGADAGGTLIKGICLLLVTGVGLLAMLDAGLGWAGAYANAALGTEAVWSVTNFLKWVCTPAAWLMGVSWEEASLVGRMLGERIVTTELGAYATLSELLATNALSGRAAFIAAYALCGFAHIPAVAITAGGIAALAPERNETLVKIAPYAFVAATLACFMTGCIAGMFAGDSGLMLIHGR